MKVRVTATAPTVYQTQSLRHFNIGCKPLGNGSYLGQMEFRTVADAREYLKQRAAMYYEADRKAMRANMGRNWLTLDAVTARINRAGQ